MCSYRPAAAGARRRCANLAGRIVDRYGIRLVLSLSVLLAGVALGALGLLAAVLVFPPTLALLRDDPAQLGLTPRGGP
jgi:MFS family permease